MLVGHVNLVLETSLVAQLREPFERLLQRDEFTHFLGFWVVAIADVHGAGFLFFGADDYGEREMVSKSVTEVIDPTSSLLSWQGRRFHPPARNAAGKHSRSLGSGTAGEREGSRKRKEDLPKIKLY